MLGTGVVHKYLLYAIGEIALVVIGILIALQINNWNSVRIANEELNSNLLYLHEDLQNNKMQLNDLKERRLKALNSSTEFINRYKQSIPISKKLWNESFFEIVIELSFKSNENAFKKVETSMIFETEKMTSIRNLIREYKEQIEQLNYTESKLNVTIEEIERKLFQNGFQDEIWDYVRVHFMDRPEIEESGVEIDPLALIKKHGEVKGIFLRYEVDAPIIIRRYEALIEKGEELNRQINIYLKMYSSMHLSSE